MKKDKFFGMTKDELLEYAAAMGSRPDETIEETISRMINANVNHSDIETMQTINRAWWELQA